MNSRKWGKGKMGNHRYRPKAKASKILNRQGPVELPSKIGHRAKIWGGVNTSGRTSQMYAGSTRTANASLERIVVRSIRKCAKRSESIA